MPIIIVLGEYLLSRHCDAQIKVGRAWDSLAQYLGAAFSLHCDRILFHFGLWLCRNQGCDSGFDLREHADEKQAQLGKLPISGKLRERSICQVSKKGRQTKANQDCTHS